MKLKFLFLNFILIALFAFSPQTEEVLVWKEDYFLQPKDFKGQIHDDGSVASATCDIDKTITAYNDSAMVTVEAVFLPNKSWKRQGKTEADILIHEQKHFDIAELYARKLRKYIMEEEFANIDELSIELNNYHKKILNELDTYQDKYDNKTNHSMNGVNQRKWDKKISEELERMNYYKNTKLTIRFNKILIPAAVSK